MTERIRDPKVTVMDFVYCVFSLLLLVIGTVGDPVQILANQCKRRKIDFEGVDHKKLPEKLYFIVDRDPTTRMVKITSDTRSCRWNIDPETGTIMDPQELKPSWIRLETDPDHCFFIPDACLAPRMNIFCIFLN